MGNTSEPYRSGIPDINQIYQIYSQSLKQSPKEKFFTKFERKQLKQILSQLFQSFQRNKKYSWGIQIRQLMLTHFSKSFEILWHSDRENFYKLILDYSGMNNNNNITNQKFFYERSSVSSSYLGNRQVKISALNSSIMQENDEIPIMISASKKIKQIELMNNNSDYMTEEDSDRKYKSESNEVYKSQCIPLSFTEFSYDSKNKSAYYNIQQEMTPQDIQRSSVIIPETVFTNRLQQSEKKQVSEMLNFYKLFSAALQQLIKSISLISCPIKHFQASLKKKLKDKKIIKSALKPSLVSSDSKKSYITRKKYEYNNALLLIELREFIDAYTEFIWKYLDLYEITETSYRFYITLETVYGIILKIVWSFMAWIGDRGYQYQEMQLPRIVKKIEKSNKIDKKSKIPEYIIQMGCEISKETSPQKYLKQIVLIYRQMSKNCESADKLLTDYQVLIYSIIKKGCHDKILRMHNIINKVMKLEDSNGEISYAWTTWSIIIELLHSYLKKQEESIAHLQGFQIVA